MLLLTEIRPVPGWPGYYAARRGGKIYSDRWGRPMREMAQGMSDGGYPRVWLNRDRKRATKKVHRLIYEAFCGRVPTGLVVRHLDGDRTNNDLSNLAAGTCLENSQDAIRHGTMPRGERSGRAKLSTPDVLVICDNYAAGGHTYHTLSRRYGVTAATVGAVVAGRTWRHVLRPGRLVG